MSEDPFSVLTRNSGLPDKFPGLSCTAGCNVKEEPSFTTNLLLLKAGQEDALLNAFLSIARTTTDLNRLSANPNWFVETTRKFSFTPTAGKSAQEPSSTVATL